MAEKDVPGYLPGMQYGFLDKTADSNHPKLDYVIETFQDGKVGMIVYANSDHTQLTAGEILAALALNAPEAEWTAIEKTTFLGTVNGEGKYLGELLVNATMLGIQTGKCHDAMADIVAAAAPEQSAPTDVISAITKNRWTAESLIVSGTLTNKSTIAVSIKGIDAEGFDQDQKVVGKGSDFTIVHNDLAPGEVVNFKVALEDKTKRIKFVKVTPHVVQP